MLARPYASLAACPACYRPLEGGEPACPHCHYSAAVCVQRLPFAAPLLALILDTEGALAPAEHRALTTQLENLIRQFPQVSPHLCLTALPAGIDPREFGFWLANASPVADVAAAARRRHSILLVVDLHQRFAAFTVGYALERWLRPEVLQRVLDVSRPWWLERDPAPVLHGLWRELEKELHLAWRAAQIQSGPHAHASAPF